MKQHYAFPTTWSRSNGTKHFYMLLALLQIWCAVSMLCTCLSNCKKWVFSCNMEWNTGLIWTWNPAKCSTVTLDRQQDPIKIWVIHFSDQAIVAESARLSEVQVKDTWKPLESLPRTIGFSFILNDAYFRVIRPEERKVRAGVWRKRKSSKGVNPYFSVLSLHSIHFPFRLRSMME